MYEFLILSIFSQLQTEKNLKMRAEEKFRSKPPSSGSSSRLKPTTQESRTVSKREVRYVRYLLWE